MGTYGFWVLVSGSVLIDLGKVEWGTSLAFVDGNDLPAELGVWRRRGHCIGIGPFLFSVPNPAYVGNLTVDI